MSDTADRREDEALLAAYVADGDGAAFHELVRRYERRVYAICYRYFSDHSDAQDAAQDTFLAIARRGGTFRGGSKLSTWIYRIAVNACNDIARKRSRRPQTPVEDIVATSNAAGVETDDPDPQTLKETELEVHRALARLDETSRTLVILVAIEGFTYLEAAGIVDMPVGTVKSRVHRAKAELADLLAGVADPEAGIRGSGGTRTAATTSNQTEAPSRGHREPPTEEPV